MKIYTVEGKLHKNEKLILSALENSREPTTMDIIKKSGLSKVTALKYLQKLEDTGVVEYRMIGPSKVWSLSNRGGQMDVEKLKPRVFDLLRQFEELTGSKASIVVESNGLNLMTRLTVREMR